jgi:hypothetical protein
MLILVFLQTRGNGGSLFFVFQCWQDGIRMIRRILKAREYDLGDQKVHVNQIYEHCWGERFDLDYLDCPFFDTFAGVSLDSSSTGRFCPSASTASARRSS